MHCVSDQRLDQLLVRAGLIDEHSLSRARSEAFSRQRKLAETVIDLGFADQRTLAEVIARESGLSLVSPIDMDAARRTAKRLPVNLARQHLVVPVELDGDTLVVAMIDPFEPGIVEVLESTTALTIRRVVGVRSEIEMAVIELYGADEQAEITLFAPRALSLELASDAEAEGMAGMVDDLVSYEPDNEGAEADHGDDAASQTIAAHPRAFGAEDSTAPSVARDVTDSDRIARVERQMFNVARSLALIQARLDAIDARISHFVESSRASR
jgi:hypothetical protein